MNGNDLEPAAYQPGATFFPEVSATGEDPADQATSDDPRDGDTSATLTAPSDPAGKPPVIFNPEVTDAICEALHCDEPELPYNPEITDDICQALDCDDDGDGTLEPNVDPCDLLGCPTPKRPGLGRFIDVLRRL